MIDGGEIVADGTPDEIFSDEERLYGWGLEMPLSMQRRTTS